MITNATLSNSGQTGVKPQIRFLQTDDSFAEIITANWMQKLISVGYSSDPTDVFLISYGNNYSQFFTQSINGNTITLIPQSLSGTTDTYGGGGTSNAFTIAGLTSDHAGQVTIRTSTNAVSVAKAVPTTNTLTVTFSADPGAGTTLDYNYQLKAQG